MLLGTWGDNKRRYGMMIKEQQTRRMKQLTSCSFYLPFIFLLMVFGSLPSWSVAAAYPDRPINMVVPFAPGGALDLGSRVVADKIAEFLGQPLVSVYKPGGGGLLGVAFVAKAKSDGYTIVAAGPSTVSLPTIVKKVDYKFGDLVPLGMYGKIPHFLIVKADAKWKTLKDFVEEEKRSPGTLKIGFLGKLTSGDFIIILLNRSAGIKLTQIPYTSTGVALASLLGGHIDAALVTGAGGLLESGQIRILAVAEEQRLEGLSDVPTFKESGYPIAFLSWNSLFFPKETPKEIIDKLARAQESAIKRYSKEIKERLRGAEIWADFRSLEDTMEQYKKEYLFYLKLCEELGVVAK
jgi:tripartite-type tricarboxylate transporter receptor subunit TctC